MPYRPGIPALAVLLVAVLFAPLCRAEEYRGTIKVIDSSKMMLTLSQEGLHKDIRVTIAPDALFDAGEGEPRKFADLRVNDRITVTNAAIAGKIHVVLPEPSRTPLLEFWHNFTHNLFKPLLLFFYMGFLVPILRVKFEFPYVMYQALTIYLLIAIGWHGGEELANLDSSILGRAVGFMATGFATNFVVGILAYIGLSLMTRMRRIDKSTVAGFYGSDSAGTFVTCLGVLAAARVEYDAYMPVMLAVMEIPGCLVALYLVSRLRDSGMDPAGNMPNEPGYDLHAEPPIILDENHDHTQERAHVPLTDRDATVEEQALESEAKLAMQLTTEGDEPVKRRRGITPQLLHEVFLNPGLYLLFGGIVIGFISGKQGPTVTRDDDNFFVVLFQGVLCLFLLEMGMTASRKLKDLKTAGIGYILFGILAPNVFATIGIIVCHLYSTLTGTPFEPGTYILFAVLCGSASYIAVPAVQRLAIPEASPTLPLAASLGLTFSYNVTIGIPVYMEIAKLILRIW